RSWRARFPSCACIGTMNRPVPGVPASAGVLRVIPSPTKTASPPQSLSGSRHGGDFTPHERASFGTPSGILPPPARGIELGPIAQEQATIARLQLFVRAGVDEARPVALDADDAGAGRRPQAKLANQFPGGSRGAGDVHGVEIGIAQNAGQGDRD